ncbi:DUF1549 domain-containing protein [Acanthopleuribacter pedis]|uniref:DUF1553 domain-containing protein n=1 Tax=Acanthopleuribacter pedis TaxID=442870 RepID=A0A8J7U2N6_9BACT|nr:DUF1549 domain-containing protein [Acanthopleuribacter pedis]MBO1317458.1 DUF1553 domain-containing protein [Acanthopleuribacter pedis]
MKAYLPKMLCFLVGALFSLSAAAGSARHTLENTQNPQLKAFQMVKRGSTPAVDDLTFLHRVHLDLTGHIPSQETIAAFTANPSASKYAAEIERLFQSEAYVDRWVTFLADLLRNEPIFEDTSAPFRNAMHNGLREHIRNNTPWDVLAKEVLTGNGSAVNPSTAFGFWAREIFLEDFRLEVLDNQVANITETFLGIQTNCVSCHDGQYHLEQVNVGLVAKKREDFWAMAAFLSQSYVYYPFSAEDEDESFDGFLQKLHLVDLDRGQGDMEEGELFADERFMDGEYNAQSVAGEGMRVPRNGGVIQPKYMFSGESPRQGESRREALARLITSDPQFARNMVNRIWAAFFGEGFVHPLNGWDPGRTDAATAAAHQSTVQPRTPALLDALTNEFIQSGFDLKWLQRRIVTSGLYQARLTETEDKNDYLGYWRSNKRVRRLPAEAIVDRYHHALGLEQRYVYRGNIHEAVSSTWALPSPGEPEGFALIHIPEENFDEDNLVWLNDPTNLGFQSIADYFYRQDTAHELLVNLGRGRLIANSPRENTSTVQRALFMMNQPEFHAYMGGGFEVELDEEEVATIGRLYLPASPFLQAKISELSDGRLDQDGFLTEIFTRFLLRAPSAAERTLFKEYYRGKEIYQGVYDTAWALINHPDFIHQR